MVDYDGKSVTKSLQFHRFPEEYMGDLSHWNQIESIVRKVIHEWDPYRLLAAGAPQDEWDNEISQIIGRINQVISPDNGAAVISDVFTSAFQAEGFSPEDCADVGKRLFDALETRRTA